jgi:diguanylate cyclase (GGDEF)-like protein
MIAPEIPADEPARLASLRALNVLDTPPEERFDRITRLARRVFEVPIALVSLVDEDRQWFKSCQGLGAAETPRAVSFCGNAIHAAEPLVVPDALEDPRFRDNPLVTGEPRIRFYAGHPLSDPQGHRLGTLCIIDRRPRQLERQDLEQLRDLAALAERELAHAAMSASQQELIAERDRLQRQALLDPLTRGWNRGGIAEILERECTRAARSGSPLSAAMLDLDHFKRVNDTYGHPAGDQVLIEVAGRARAALRPYDAVGRYGGEEFLLVLPETSVEGARAVCERVRSRISGSPVPTDREPLVVTASIGVSGAGAGARPVPRELVAAADAALYAAKRAGRDRVV